jgi:hypothetical protein
VAIVAAATGSVGGGLRLVGSVGLRVEGRKLGLARLIQELEDLGSAGGTTSAAKDSMMVPIAPISRSEIASRSSNAALLANRPRGPR